MSTENISLNEEILQRLLMALESLGVKKYGRVKKVAGMIGYSEARVSEILSGKIEFTPKFLSILSAKFYISEEWLKSGKGEMFQMGNVDIVNIPGRSFRKSDREEDEINRLEAELRKEKEQLSTAEFYRVMAGVYGVLEELRKERKGDK